LGTPERQSLCESHRQRRWLTYWSYTHLPLDREKNEGDNGEIAAPDKLDFRVQWFGQNQAAIAP